MIRALFARLLRAWRSCAAAQARANRARQRYFEIGGDASPSVGQQPPMVAGPEAERSGASGPALSDAMRRDIALNWPLVMAKRKRDDDAATEQTQ